MGGPAKGSLIRDTNNPASLAPKKFLRFKSNDFRPTYRCKKALLGHWRSTFLRAYINAEIMNPLIQIVVSVVIPVFILNKGGSHLGPQNALFVALAFPLALLVFELIKEKKWSFVALLGLLHTGVTGIFALMHFEGIWFAIKEASFPTLIGLFVIGSAFTRNPFAKSIFMNEQIFHLNVIQEKMQDPQKKKELDQLMKRLTLLLSGSFALSAVLNFSLGIYIFQPIDPQLNSESRAQVLNEQIARMTSWSYPIIALPSMILMVVLFMYALKQLIRITGVEQNQLLKN